MRRLFIAGLLAASAVFPGIAIAQQEDFSRGRPGSDGGDAGSRPQRGSFDGQRGDGGFRQRQFQPQVQAQPQAPPAPIQQAPVAPSQVQQGQGQRGGFDQGRRGYRQGFQRDQQQGQNAPVFQNQPNFQNQQRGVRPDFRRDGGQFQSAPAFQNGQGFNNGYRGQQRFGDNDRFRRDGNRYDGNRYDRGGRGYYNGYRNRDFGNRGAWSRDWRSNNNYNWQSYRSYNRDIFRLPRYYAPGGWGYGYRRFGIGFTLSSILFDQSYWIEDPEYYRLPPAYGPYEWVRYYNDALLVDIRTGYIVDTVYDIFW